MPIRNAISIDLEEWFHPEFVRRHAKSNPEPQIIESTNQIIDLLDKYNVKATFFILGEIAKKHPDLIKSIHEKGHEIAFHGMSHLPLWELNYQKLNNEFLEFKQIIESLLGKIIKIEGFRAPTFSIDNTTKYGFKCLIENDYIYDSSIVPMRNPYYGLRNAPRSIYKPNLNDLSKHDDNAKIIEFPITTLNFKFLGVPIGGGFYMRIIPYFIYKFLLKFINKKKKPFVIYFHPWETFYKTHRVEEIGFFKYFVTYFGITNMLKKIERLLQDFQFEPIRNVLNSYE